METYVVMMVVSRPEVAEQMLLAGDLPCPRCRGVLRPFGTGRTRTVRGVGADTVTVTPRRARCADCRVTQILLPTELLVRRADSTAAIGNALVAKAGGAGFRSIAARFGRPESTVRRWLRAEPDEEDTDQENASTTRRLTQKSDVEDTLRPLQSCGVIYRSGPVRSGPGEDRAPLSSLDESGPFSVSLGHLCVVSVMPSNHRGHRAWSNANVAQPCLRNQSERY